MSAEETGERQRDRLRELGLAWSELEQLRDVDTIEDAARDRGVVSLDPAPPQPCGSSTERDARMRRALHPRGAGRGADPRRRAARTRRTRRRPSPPRRRSPRRSRPVRSSSWTARRRASSSTAAPGWPRSPSATPTGSRSSTSRAAAWSTRWRRRSPPGTSRSLPAASVLAPIEYEDTLLRISLPAGRATALADRRLPPRRRRGRERPHFVGDEGGDTITVLEGDEVVDELPAPEQPGGVAVSGGVLAVVAVAAREIAFYDTETLEQLAVAAGRRRAEPHRRRARRTLLRDRHRGRRDPRLRGRGPEGPRLLDRTNVPGSPYGIAVDFRRDRLWVTRTAANRVVRLEITDLAPKIAERLPDRPPAEQRRRRRAQRLDRDRRAHARYGADHRRDRGG